MIKVKKIFNPFLSIIFDVYTKLVTRNFAHIGKGCNIRPILNTSHPENIILGDDNSFGVFCWIGTNETITSQPKLIFGNRVSIGAYSMIIAANQITIGNNVLMSERITILDHYHGYENVDVPIIDQSIKNKGRIEIGDDCFIGINSVIIGNVKIGKHAVIGANSVVTRDVPSFAVVVGAPAKVIKKYDFVAQKWRAI